MLLLTGLLLSRSDPTPADVLQPAVGIPAVEVVEIEEVVAQLASERSRLEERARRGNAVPQDTSLPTRTVSVRPAEPWTRARRSNRDLAALVLAGNYEVEDFVRHVLLNPDDVALAVERMREFGELVDSLRSGSRGVRSRLQAVALRDRQAIVQQNPAAVPAMEVSAAEAERRAQQIVDFFRRRGEDITPQQAKARVDRGEAFSVNMPANSSFVNGKVYRNTSFGALPQFDADFDQLRQVALGELSVIVAWFVGYGYCAFSPELEAAFSRVQTMSPREVERLAR